MKSSPGYLKRLLHRFSYLLIIFLLLLPKSAYADQSSISISGVASYTINSNGSLGGALVLNLSNTSTSPVVVKYYALALPFNRVSQATVRNGTDYYQFTSSNKLSSTTLTVDLNDHVISASKPLQLHINFTADNFVSTGVELNRIEIPVKLNSVELEKVTVKTPRSFGEINFLLSSASSLQQSNEEYVIVLAPPTDDKLVLIFSETPTYRFKLNKTLQNQGDSQLVYEVNLPIVNYRQNVLIDSVTPSPNLSYRDIDGNLFLSYLVEPDSSFDVEVRGSILLGELGIDEEVSQYPSRQKYIAQNQYWKLTDPVELKRFQFFLRQKGLTLDNVPTDISTLTQQQRYLFYYSSYLYTIERLNLDLDSQANKLAIHSGAETAIKDRKSSTVYDYADVLIALLRSHNVPSRMVLGHISNISSLYESGFYHVWVEAWDKDKGWFILDPALQELTGQDMYDSKQSDHIAIVNRVSSPLKPRMLYTEIEDSTFEFTNNSVESRNRFEVFVADRKITPLRGVEDSEIVVTNSGNNILTSLQILSPNLKQIGEQNTVQVVIPGESTTIPFRYEMPIASLLDPEMDKQFKVKVKAKSLLGINIEKESEGNIQIEYPWWWVPLSYALSTTIFLFILMFIYTFIERGKRWKQATS